MNTYLTDMQCYFTIRDILLYILFIFWISFHFYSTVKRLVILLCCHFNFFLPKIFLFIFISVLVIVEHQGLINESLCN